ncbi:hypothetical protein HY489_00945 [Candidatus Woesearchaeota archaeon]|nr:hypothetical protein [Candidatus Woesearchaeota archaeon]
MKKTLAFALVLLFTFNNVLALAPTPVTNINGFVYDSANNKYTNPKTNQEYNYNFQNGVYVRELPPLNGKPNGAILTRDASGAFYEVGYLGEGDAKVITYYTPFSDGSPGQQRRYTSIPQEEKEFVIQDLVAPTWGGAITYASRMRQPSATAEPREYGLYPNTGYSPAAPTPAPAPEPTPFAIPVNVITTAAEKAGIPFTPTEQGIKIGNLEYKQQRLPDGRTAYVSAANPNRHLVIQNGQPVEIVIENGKVTGYRTFDIGGNAAYYAVANPVTPGEFIGAAATPLPATPPPGKLPDADQKLIEDARKDGTLNAIKVYVDNDGKISATKIPQINGKEVPPHVRNAVLNSDVAKFQVTGTAPANNQPDTRIYKLELKPDKDKGSWFGGHFFDFEKKDTITFSPPPAGSPAGSYQRVEETESKGSKVELFSVSRTRREGKITIVEPRKVKKDDKEETIEVPTREGRILYDKDGKNQIGQVTVDYKTRDEVIKSKNDEAKNPKTTPGRKKELTEEVGELNKKPTDYREPEVRTVVRDNDGKTILWVNPDGNYFKPKLDTTGKPILKDGTPDSERVDEDKAIDFIAAELKKQNNALTDEEAKKQAEALKKNQDKEQLESGNVGVEGYWELASFYRTFTDFFKTYDQMSGYAQLSSLFMGDYVEKNRQRLAQSFCAFAGIDNCLVSAICGQIHEITASNVLVGRDPGGKYVNSASLNAERSGLVELEGLDAQQLRDILGNTTTIAGKFIDLTDPSVDLRALGQLKLRLYHVEYSIENNAMFGERMRYNLEFRRNGAPALTEPPNITGQYASIEEFGGDYEQYIRRVRPINSLETVSSARWFPQDKQLEHRKTDHDHKYKYSTNEYDSVCLTFNPGLPSGSALSSKFVNELCVPITEYAGGPTDIEEVDASTKTAQTAAQAGKVSKEGDRV